ncbi:c-type cytochrome [Spirosoma sp. HMF4905]|uniref:C-type cytochrome n=1 Tax=Spirosoma arboris TaxID=2682092 RepID=A0A7K1SH80_9BACT|nr:cytochrome c [Spirosoma arboris]MVM33165.1 c-type cytochrome [Spirosoma arboris]
MNSTSHWGVVMVCLWAIAGLLSASLLGCHSATLPITENKFDSLSLNSFVEPGFPVISTYLDARKLGKLFPDDNVVARGLVIHLDDSAYVCFDQDLLRWSVAWSGKSLTKSMLPEVSYRDFFNKKNTVPLVAGQPDIANGIYPGWSAGKPVLNEIRPKAQYREGFTWGPLPVDHGRWKGSYVYGGKLVLAYSVAGTDIFEMPGCIRQDKEIVYTRTLQVGASSDTLFLNAAEVRGGTKTVSDGKTAYIYYGTHQDSVIAVGSKQDGNSVRVVNGQYFSVSLPPSDQTRKVTVCLWKGLANHLNRFHSVTDKASIDLPVFKAGGHSHWPEKVLTKGKIAPDSAAFVTDLLTLPIPNPWKRNVRVTDIAFLDEQRAAVTTFEGDVWLVSGIDQQLEHLSWKRFASGLYEPMSIEAYKGQLYIFGKAGIVRLHDLNGDGEADYYENFCDLMQQSAESYEWAADMVISEKYGILIAKGGGVTARPGITKTLTEGFRAGSNHSGVIMRISLDGKKTEQISTGFRAPYLGFHPVTGMVTATDQQGNYVPSTPIYLVEKGDFFGVPATSHRTDKPDPKRPITWIPHRIDRSAGSQVWVTSQSMGPLNNKLLHFSFGRPGLFEVLIDSTSNGVQGAVAPVNAYYSTPILKGTIGPRDGQLYMAGFNLFGSSSKGISAIQRLRYTGKRSYMPNHVEVGRQGILLSFDSALDVRNATDPSSYRVKRWNYKRTEAYGSGHFKLDGTPGEEILPVLAAYLSADKKKILLLVPDMQKVDQMEVLYKVTASDGKPVRDGVWFSVNQLDNLGFQPQGFANVDLKKLQLSKAQFSALVKFDPPITRERGKELFEKMGCIGCHSPGTETAGMYGPPFKGLYGSIRKMADGSTLEANEAYLKESILEPSRKVVKGYDAEMPSFQGVLSDSDIEALLLYIMYLKY